MYEWMKKLHMYAGLLSFTAFAVWGVAGLQALFAPAPGTRPRPQPEVRYADFHPPANLTDQQVADRMAEALHLPFLRPGRRPRRDEQGRLTLTYFTPNGRRRLILLEDQDKVRIEANRTNLVGFLNSLHVATFLHSQQAWPLKMWGAYNEFSLWALLFMSGTGLYLWLATRPGLRWASYTLAGGAAAFALFFVLGR